MLTFLFHTFFCSTFEDYSQNLNGQLRFQTYGIYFAVLDFGLFLPTLFL